MSGFDVDAELGEHEVRLRRALHTVARSTPVRDDYASLLRRIEAGPARGPVASRWSWRAVSAVAAAAAVVVGLVALGVTDDDVQVGPAGPDPSAQQPAGTVPDPTGPTTGPTPPTTEVPSRSTAPGGMVAMLDALPPGWTSSWTVNDDGPLAVRLLRSGAASAGEPATVALVVVSRGPLDRVPDGDRLQVGGVGVTVFRDPGALTVTASWDQTWADGSVHGVEVTIAGPSPESEVLDVLVPDAFGAVPGLEEVPYAVGAGPPGPSALYGDGASGTIRVGLHPGPWEAVVPDAAAIRALTGATTSLEELEVDGRRTWVLSQPYSLDPRGSAVVGMELPSGRIAVVEGPDPVVRELVDDVVEVPVDEAIERLAAGRPD